MSKEIEIKTGNLPASSIQSLGTIQNEREALINAYDDVIGLEITEENIKIFKELRLKIRDNRTKGIEPWHKTNKAVSLAIGRTIDSIKNREVEINKRMEDSLFNAEKHFENIEKERIEKLNSERIELVRPYLEDVEHLVLHDMEEDVFESYLNIKKRNFKAIQEIERKEEIERLAKIEAEEKENERIRLENEILKKQAEKLEETRIEEEKKRIEIAKIEEEKRAKEEAEKQKKIDSERKKQAEILLKEKQKIEKLKAELEAKKQAEKLEEKIRLKAELEAKKQAELKAKEPVKKQLSTWVDSFEIERSQIDNEISLEIMQKFNSFKKWALFEIEKL